MYVPNGKLNLLSYVNLYMIKMKNRCQRIDNDSLNQNYLVDIKSSSR